MLDFLASSGPGPEVIEPSDRTGERVGPYVILGQAGRGGMATVYEAERADGQWEQRVAIKVIRRGLDTDDVIRLFLAERQILSTLEHPNISRLLDGGATEDGLPYLVMEHVVGEPITDHCDARALGLTDRLGLFLDVCRSVQYAHRNLVVHRDLKPSNILVTAEGRVKLLDFGVAKLLDESNDATRTARRRLTPQFASPEQVRGDRITTSSDIYQLGVLLCELVSGRRPYDVDAISPARLEEQITGSQPERPSRLVSQDSAAARGTTPDRLARRLRGDLDAIVARCLRAEPADRYPSAEALAADVERYLNGLPVEATRGAVRYRVGKFVRRNAAGVAVTTAFVGLLITAVVALSIERSRAVAAAETADQVSDFLASVFADADPTTGVGDTMSVRTLLGRGARRVEVELADQPALQAELFGVIGTAYQNLGLLDEAIETQRLALDRSRRSYSSYSEQVETAIQDLSLAYRVSRQFEDALPLVEEVVEIRRARFGADHPRVAVALALVGTTVRDAIGPDSAEVILRQARGMIPADMESAESVRVTLDLAYVLRAQGKAEEAEALYREALPAYRALDVDPGSLGPQLNNFAYLLTQRGAHAEAAALYEESLALHTATHGAGHPTSLLLASNLASAFLRDGRTDEAMAVLGGRITAAEEQWPDGHWRRGAVNRTYGIADARNRNGREAVARFREAASEYASAVGEDDPRTAATRAWLGAAMLVVDRDSAGLAELDRAIAVLSGFESPNPAAWDINAVADYLEANGLDEHAAPLRDLLDD